MSMSIEQQQFSSFRRAKSALAKTSSTATLAPLPESPRQEWACSAACLDHLLQHNESPWRYPASPTACRDRDIFNNHNHQSVSCTVARGGPIAAEYEFPLPASCASRSCSVAATSLKQSHKVQIQQLYNQITFLNRKNAELEMNSIMTFTNMSKVCPSCTKHSSHSTAFSTSASGHNYATAPSTTTAFDSLAKNVKQPVAVKASTSVSSNRTNHDQQRELHHQEQQIKHLQHRIQQLEYVSRLWDKYMVSLTLLQQQNRDLRNELEDFRRQERKERLNRVFGGDDDQDSLALNFVDRLDLDHLDSAPNPAVPGDFPTN